MIGALLVPTASAAAAAAAEAPICADRPGKASATCTVPAGHLQIETGLADWTLQKGRGERDTGLAIGETVFKFGLTERSDIEIDLTPWQRTTSRAEGVHNSASGFGDIAVGYKQQLRPAAAPLQVAIYPYVKIPTARRPLGNGKWEGGLLLPIGYSIGGSSFSITLTPEIDWVADGDDRGHHLAMAQVASLGWQANSQLNLSAEFWGQWNWDPSGTVRQASADGAITYLLGDNMQLDAGMNFGLNHATPDFEVYSGLSVRF